MRRVLKWAVAAWLLGEIWTRGGRELLLGTAPGGPGPGDVPEIVTWVTLPPRSMDEYRGHSIVKDGVPIGRVEDQRWSDEVKAMQVRVRIVREYLGWPIHVAVGQATPVTLKSLGLG